MPMGVAGVIDPPVCPGAALCPLLNAHSVRLPLPPSRCPDPAAGVACGVGLATTVPRLRSELFDSMTCSMSRAKVKLDEQSGTQSTSFTRRRRS